MNSNNEVSIIAIGLDGAQHYSSIAASQRRPCESGNEIRETPQTMSLAVVTLRYACDMICVHVLNKVLSVCVIVTIVLICLCSDCDLRHISNVCHFVYNIVSYNNTFRSVLFAVHSCSSQK